MGLCVPFFNEVINTPLSSNTSLGFHAGSDHGKVVIDSILDARLNTDNLHVTDQVLSVDGVSSGGDLALFERKLGNSRKPDVVIETASASGQITRHVLHRDAQRLDRALARVGLTPKLYLAASVICNLLFDILFVLSCGVILLVKRFNDRLAPWASVMMLILVIGHGLGGFLLSEATHSRMVSIILDYAQGLLVPLIIIVFPTGRFRPRWSLFLLVILPLSAIINNSSLGLVGELASSLLLLLALAPSWATYYRKSSEEGYQQVRWAIIGIVAAAIAVVLGYLAGWAANTSVDYATRCWLLILHNVFTSLVSLMLAGSITVALLRYRLYSADATISRSIVYGAMTIALLAIFAGSEKIVEILGEEYFGEQLGALAGGLGAAIAAVCVGPIHHRVTHWAQHRFRSGLVKLRDGLPILVGDMRETATPAALADAMLVKVETGVRAKHGAVVVGRTLVDARDIEPTAVERWLASAGVAQAGSNVLEIDRADPVFPMRVQLRAPDLGCVGWLLLGPRPDHSFYGREERQALRMIADPVARALAVALSREQLEAARQERERARDQEISSLRLMIAAVQSELQKAMRPTTA